MGKPISSDVCKVQTYCYQCVAGPDLLTVKVEDGVATEVEPNFRAEGVHPGNGKVCVKAFGLVQKTYSPHRILTPMKRTNPKKGRNEDPGFAPISWDEAFTLITDKLKAVRAKGLTDENGYPRVAASFGGAGTPAQYMGTFPSFLAAWGPVDLGFGSGQGVKCTHSEHLYGELWHRAFTVVPDTPNCKYIVSFGGNVEASGGVAGVWRHAAARASGTKRVQVEPHLSITGACSAEWVPIKPKTDAAFLYAMIHVLILEHPVSALDEPHLKVRTNSPYLVGPNGYFLRDPQSRKPLIWDLATGRAVAQDTPKADAALEGTYTADGIEEGPDGQVWTHQDVSVRPSFELLRDHMRSYTPEWAAQVCDVPAASIRRVANEFLAHAQIGATIEIEGRVLPYRPVAVLLGKTVNNGWGGFECCWGRTLLACLVGGLETPGGTLGTTVRLNRPAGNRKFTVRPTIDGFMEFPWNPTERETWSGKASIRNTFRALVPLAANSPWSPALGPTHFSWMFIKETPKNLPPVSLPDVWFVYRTNPAISFWDTEYLTEQMARFPFVVCFAMTHNETNHMADVLLPDRTDLEGLQLIRIGGTKYQEQFWDTQGVALRQPVVGAQGETRDFTDISTELARRVDLLEPYNKSINKGSAGVALAGKAGNRQWDFSLELDKPYGSEEIWDRSCRSASAELTNGESSEGLDWYKTNGFRVAPFSKLDWYLYPEIVDQNLRFELPYQERLLRVGKQLANRLHENGIDWWEEQLAEYQSLPKWKDFPGLWEKSTVKAGGAAEDYPFWLVTSRSMQYAWGSNMGIQLMKEMAGNIKGHEGVIINPKSAARLGVSDGDWIEVSTPRNKTKGRAVLRQGIRPDTILMMSQFGHWATPYAKDFQVPSMNNLTPMSMDLTDATGSGADLVRVRVERLEKGAA